MLEKRLKDMEDPNWEPTPDLMQFVLDATKKTGEGRSLDYQVNAIIGTGRAALFTTGLTIYQLVYDLATHPEYIEPLRQELMELGDVPFNRANVNKLTKLDSFIRESQRWSKFMLGKLPLAPATSLSLAHRCSYTHPNRNAFSSTNPNGIVGTFRKVLQDLTLSDGTLLPSGTYVGTNVQNSVFDNSALANPYEFDGFRFDRLRSEPGKEQMYQSVQTSADHLVYGVGNQACPGRYFAAHEAKVVTSRILMNYDFKLKGERGEHPFSRASGIMTEADPTVQFLFRKRVWKYV